MRHPFGLALEYGAQRSRRRLAIAIAPCLLLVVVAGRAADPTPDYPPSVALPARSPVKLRLVAKLGPGPAKENSGIVRSRTRDDLFWMQNDSGDEPRVYPIRASGENYQSTREPQSPGVLVGGAINVDWEDIAVDADGYLILPDLGNNDNDRRDLVLYYLYEPSPLASRTTVAKKVFVHYPDQPSFPAPRDNFNFDCEAVFTVGNTVHLLTKHRSDQRTKLYRLDQALPDRSNPLTLVGQFDTQGQAVAADCSADGLRLVVATYEKLWLFERSSQEKAFFAGRISWAPYDAEQVEAVCFADDNTLYLADENRAEVYAVEIADLTRLETPAAAP